MTAGPTRPPAAVAPAAAVRALGPIGVVSANHTPVFQANEVQRGMVRTEEAVGFVGVGLGAGLAALAACAPTLFLAPLCGIVAATAGMSGAAVGGLAGDVAADAGDTRRIHAHVGTGTELQEELRLRVIDRLREAGYVAIDLGNADAIAEPAQGMPSLVIQTTLRRIAARGAGRENFTVFLKSSFRPLPAHELQKRRRVSEDAQSQSTIPTGSLDKGGKTFEYTSPALPLGADAEQTGRVIQTGISAGIADTAARIAAEDFERLRTHAAR
jgi:hypothetical protein